MSRSPLLIAAVLLLIASSLGGSTLRVVVDKTPVRSAPGGASVLQVAWADAAVTAAVTIDVYSVPMLPSSSAGLDRLQALNADTWLNALSWELQRDGDKFEPMERPTVLTATVRHRGPSAADPIDRDTTVDMVSYRARVSLGSLPSGDYVVRFKVAGLTSDPSVFAVRKGDEDAALRDAYLAEKALRAPDYVTFKRLELERIKVDESKADAWVALGERSLVDGTLPETREYFANALRVMDENARKASIGAAPERAHALAAAVDENRRRIQKLDAVLPDYFAHRPEWSLSVENHDGKVRYVVRDRETQHVVRVIE